MLCVACVGCLPRYLLSCFQAFCVYRFLSIFFICNCLLQRCISLPLRDPVRGTHTHTPGYFSGSYFCLRPKGLSSWQSPLLQPHLGRPDCLPPRCISLEFFVFPFRKLTKGQYAQNKPGPCQDHPTTVVLNFVKVPPI